MQGIKLITEQNIVFLYALFTSYILNRNVLTRVSIDRLETKILVFVILLVGTRRMFR